jgi:hypothetical protein
VSAYLDAMGVEWVDWEDRVEATRPGPGDGPDREPGGTRDPASPR